MTRHNAQTNSPMRLRKNVTVSVQRIRMSRNHRALGNEDPAKDPPANWRSPW